MEASGITPEHSLYLAVSSCGVSVCIIRMFSMCICLLRICMSSSRRPKMSTYTHPIDGSNAISCCIPDGAVKRPYPDTNFLNKQHQMIHPYISPTPTMHILPTNKWENPPNSNPARCATAHIPSNPHPIINSICPNAPFRQSTTRPSSTRIALEPSLSNFETMASHSCLSFCSASPALW